MLKTYQEKRDFSKTPEPKGGEGGTPRDHYFVVQKHDARNLHYDFRLAVDGVLKSWAVPKGPSLNPSDKRLAIETEDHPLDYAVFEGTIPKGEYGGGTVLLWDHGKFEPEGDPRKGLKSGKLKFQLDGEKLKGAFELVRTGRDPDKPQWLLFKRQDKYASGDGAVIEHKPNSVKTGRSLKEIAGKAEHGSPKGLLAFLRQQPRTKPLAKPPEVKPQLATLAPAAPESEKWIHEIKWDGYRLLAEKHNGRVRLWTRQRKDWTDKFPTIAEGVAQLPGESFVLDGELVALDSKGRSHFQNLQNAVRHGKKAQLAYYCFDLPYAEGFDLRKLPLEARKEALTHIIGTDTKKGPVRYSDHLEGSGEAFYQHACQIELEGIIAKRRDAPYVSTRSRDWLKVKCTRRQEFVVCGFTPPTGSRRYLGSLALGVREDGTWRYAGQVGTGFDQNALKDLHGRLEPLIRKTSPFAAAETRDAPSEITWTTPQVIVEVVYTEITESGRLRHPSFQGIREDKQPADVHWEKPVPATEIPGQSKMASKQNTNKPTPRKKAKTKAAPLAVPEDAVVEGIRISNPDREVFPEAGITKGELAVYYARAAEYMLPYLGHRPLSLLRCPRGREKQCFFQKHFRESVPPSVELIDIVEKKGKEPYSYVAGAPGIVALAQYGVLEFHPWGSRIDKVERPDNLIFDLDPDEGVAWEDIITATLTLRDYLADLGLQSFPKVSGGKGIHVCLPIDRRTDWQEARDFCHNVALRMAQQEPSKWIAQASKAKRKGKVFLDYLRNGRGATAVAPYSARARAGGPVALPITWDEVTPDLRPDAWNIRSAIDRLENEPDPWSDFLSTRQSLTKDMRLAVAG